MFDISPEKLIIVLVLASVILGPQRLSQTARTLARLRGELRRLTSTIPPETLNVVRDRRRALVDVLAEPREAERTSRQEPES